MSLCEYVVIDFRKPLEGAPGLLLLAALILFGATIGVSLALVFSWVEMKDSLANFLGGGPMPHARAAPEGGGGTTCWRLPL